MKLENAYFAGGCFWCITPVFRETEGVAAVTSGYSGGQEVSPVYADVKHQRTGHRETIRVDFDPERVSFETLLDLFLESVDPFDGKGSLSTGGIPTPWRYTGPAKGSMLPPGSASPGWRKHPAGTCGSAWSPLPASTTPRRSTRITT